MTLEEKFETLKKLYHEMYLLNNSVQVLWGKVAQEILSFPHYAPTAIINSIVTKTQTKGKG